MIDHRHNHYKELQLQTAIILAVTSITFVFCPLLNIQPDGTDQLYIKNFIKSNVILSFK